MVPRGECPVCRARFRGARACSRCGADLGPLMVLAAKAWVLRQRARRVLAAGEAQAAGRLASAAEELQRTPGGEALRLLATWLGGPAAPPDAPSSSG